MTARRHRSLLLLASLVLLPARAVRAAEADDLLARVKAMVARMPGSRSEGFVKPSAAELGAFREVLGRIAAYDLAGAGQALAASGLPYRLVTLADSGADGREVIVLEETGTTTKGWGTFVVDPAPRSALVLEVPHVGYDVDTETEGVDVFRLTRARARPLSPIASIASAGGPMKTSPASAKARAKAAFSERKP